MKDKEIIDILSSYAKHKGTSITLVRKNRTNVWVGRWKDEVIHEINTPLDDGNRIHTQLTDARMMEAKDLTIFI